MINLERTCYRGSARQPRSWFLALRGNAAAHDAFEVRVEPKASGMESRDRLVKINKAGQMRVGQHAQSSGKAQAATRSLGAARPIVDQQCVGI